MISAHGWTLFAHPLLLDQLEKLTAAVEKAEVKDPEGYRGTANAKLLAALRTLIFDTIPGDPTRPEYRQGETLGRKRKHWLRAKFGNGRFRLFFRSHGDAKVIVFAWVNDGESLRTYGAKTDAYRVFEGMLDKGDPPDDWQALLEAARAEGAKGRLRHAGANRASAPRGRDRP